MLHLLLTLSFASGMCGIAYEILYARLLTTYLGDAFFVSAAILATFLLGIAIGSLAAKRLLRWLWAVELGIGLYSMAVAAVSHHFSQALLGRLHPLLGGSAVALAAAVAAFLIVPAVLVGTSVPLFAAYCRGHAGDRRGEGWFESVYALYNFGAAVCVMLIEFVLLRAFGLRSALLVVASVNLASALALRRFAVPTQDAAPEASPPIVRGPAAALFMVSIASGIFQMAFLKLVEVTFGPYHENFAISVALALVGITLGTRIIARVGWSFQTTLARGAAALLLGSLLIAPVIRLWGHANAVSADLGLQTTAVKVACLALLGLLPFTVYGSTLPALVRDYRGSRAAEGTLLCVSSVGNAVGYLAAIFWVYESFSFLGIALLLAGSFAVAALLAGSLADLRRLWRTGIAALVLLVLLLTSWKEWLFSLQYREFISSEAYRLAASTLDKVEVVKRFDNHVSVVTTKDGLEMLNINGYQSLVSAKGHTIPTEIVYGSVPAVFAPRLGKAIVLGVGTGMTAGASALLFDQLTAVEINPAMLAMLPRWKEHNLNLAERPNVRVVLDDGLSFMARTGDRYDAVINTVTSPMYFSSSKLYTRDFFELVKQHLAPGGVYSMWFDARVTRQGARIIFTTLASSFRDCILVFLRGSYSQVLCSQQPMRAHPIPDAAWPAEIREKLAAFSLLPMERLIEAIVMPSHHLLDTDWAEPVNTFDRPILEYTMAAQSLRIDEEVLAPYVMVRADFRASFAHDGRLDDKALAERCARLRLLSSATPYACLVELGQGDASKPPYEYVHPVLATMHGQASPERQELIHRLIDLGHLQEAREQADDFLRLGGASSSVRLLWLRANLDNPDVLTPERIARAIRIDPISSATRRLAVAALLRQGQPQQALAQLLVLRRMNDFTDSDQALEATLRSRLAEVQP
jgi:spermidine synthase